MKNTEESTEKKSYSKIVKSNDHRLKIVKTDVKPNYSDTELKSLNYYIKNCKQKISFLTLVNKVTTTLQQYSCKTIKDAKEKANLIYDEPIIDYCLPQLNKIGIKIQEARFYRPTEEELSEYRQKLINYQAKLKRNKEILSTLKAYLISNIKSITDTTLTEYYIDEQIRNSTRQILNDEQLNNYYSNILKDNTIELNKNLEFLKILETIKKEYLDEINTHQFKAIPTYNGLGNTMTKPQHTLIADLIKKNKSEDDKRILQEILVKHVMDDKDFTKEQKEEILQFIEDNKSNKVIENCLMFPLTRDETRILRALREEIYEQIQTGQITASGVTDPQTGVTEPEVYIAHISYDKFFTLYGVSNDDKTTKHIKDILFGRSSKGLRKHIIVEDKQAISTQLILQIKEKKKKINLHKKEVETGFIITMPSFLFVGEGKLDAKNYYNQENEGHRRFITTGRMAQSDAASNIICKLEMLCHSTLHNKKKKNKILEIDLETLVNIARYQKRYKKSPTEVKNRIKDILNTLVKERYLAESWQTKKGKYEQEQYIIKPLKFTEN